MPNTHMVNTPSVNIKSVPTAKPIKFKNYAFKRENESGMRSDSLNYMSIIKSNIDAAGDVADGEDTINEMNIQDQQQLE